MSAISQVDRILQALRVQQAAMPARPRGRKTSSVAGDSKVDRRSKEIADLVIERLQGIAQDDPQRRQRVFRALLEAKLVAMFGAPALDDARLHALMDEVQRAIECDAALKPAMERTIDVLLRAGSPSGAGRQALREVLGLAGSRIG